MVPAGAMFPLESTCKSIFFFLLYIYQWEKGTVSGLDGNLQRERT